MSRVTGPNGSVTTTASRAKANAGTLAKRTRPARPSATSTVAVTRPQGHWMRTSVSGSRDLDQPALDGEAAERDHRVAAHGRIALVMQEEHGQMRAGQVRLDQQGPVHVGMPARLGHQHPSQMVQMIPGVAALVEDGGAHAAAGSRRDDPDGLARGVHLDGGDRLVGWHAGGLGALAQLRLPQAGPPTKARCPALSEIHLVGA